MTLRQAQESQSVPGSSPAPLGELRRPPVVTGALRRGTALHHTSGGCHSDAPPVALRRVRTTTKSARPSHGFTRWDNSAECVDGEDGHTVEPRQQIRLATLSQLAQNWKLEKKSI